MIKKVIFDLDDTLIINNDNVILEYLPILKKYNLESSEESLKELYDVIGEYEYNTTKYNKYELLDCINKHYNKNYDIDLVDDIIDAVGRWTYPAPKELIDTLEYLSSKYELYVLTNWFLKSQKERLEKSGIYKYFKEIKSAEEYVKPNKEAFEQFFNDCNSDECIMIGDNYNIDIKVPIELGMETIMCNFKNKNIKYDGKVITNFKELVNIL